MSWDDVKEGGSGQFLTIEAGQKTKVHILSDEPYSFRQYFNRSINKGCVVPDDFANKEARARHAMVVWDMDAGEVKVWAMSATVAMGTSGKV